MQGEDGQNQEVTLFPWEPASVLREVDAGEVRYSRGFLQCRPENWFPGFGMQWLPMAHSLGVELKLLETKPVISPPRGLRYGFVGTVDDEPIGFYMDEESATALLEAVSPGAQGAAREVVLEYLTRRLLTSLAISWSGPETSVVQFEPEMNPDSFREVGAVKLTASINANRFVVWLLIGKLMVERLDGLWRRQLHSTAGQQSESAEVHLEIAHLTIPPSSLGEYMRSGVSFDLEVAVSDNLSLVVRGQPWLPARMRNLDGQLAVEVLSGPAPSYTLPSGTTRLSIEMGSLAFDAATGAEMAQVGALWDTGITLSDQVNLVVNGEKVGAADLRSYQGRFVACVK